MKKETVLPASRLTIAVLLAAAAVAGCRTMAAPAQVDAVTSLMGNLWLDRPISVAGIEIGAGQA